MKKAKETKGITLIALVITIIVLLILVGITITQLAENGLLGKSKLAKIRTEYTSAKEILNLKLMEILTDCIDRNVNYNIREIKNNIETGKQIEIKKEYYKNDSSELKGIVVSVKEYPKYKFLIGENGKIEYVTTDNIPDTTDYEKDITDIFDPIQDFEEKMEINIGNNEKVEDYLDNLLYKINFNDMKDNVTVDENEVYATFDGQSGITIDADTLDPDRKLIGSTSKTITLWYRTNESSVSPVENVLASMGNCLSEGGGNIIQFYYKQLRAATGGNACHVEFEPDNRFDNNWHFLVAAYEDGNKVRAYYDMTEFIGNGSYYTDNATLDIGHLNNTRFYKGDMADVRVYSSALTKEQILQLYQYGQNLLKNK